MAAVLTTATTKYAEFAYTVTGQPTYIAMLGDTAFTTLLVDWLPVSLAAVVPLICLAFALCCLSKKREATSTGHRIIRQITRAKMSAKKLHVRLHHHEAEDPERPWSKEGQGKKLSKQEQLTANMKGAYGNAGRANSGKTVSPAQQKMKAMGKR
eukprot:CAMPEP_0174725538 /NCGR_PEP_ID=MMETSP1094-20130205/45856_1 /TAXON_ID=156173 /ORGANISM="Chrysochromulina brevifilum, Strain UTEX LB 985" /LENGTH=153 /DNA_ID=CAMNT_0015926961 /DNA_START=11 /DNA_END=472 /DNA_ORIENTATION=-